MEKADLESSRASDTLSLGIYELNAAGHGVERLRGLQKFGARVDGELRRVRRGK